MESGFKPKFAWQQSTRPLLLCTVAHSDNLGRVREQEWGPWERGKPLQSVNDRSEDKTLSNLGGCFKVLEVVEGPEKNVLCSQRHLSGLICVQPLSH